MFGLSRSERAVKVGELQELYPEVICWPELQTRVFPTQCKLVGNTGYQGGSKVYEFYF